ncbi:general secretion pathway protein-like protein [delta proteobacterium NaphS2]|nr:general secretion pathway protein-like protein [delta proteobacterium NaphS2]
MAMYKKVYGLTHYPFEKDLEPDKLFGSKAADELEARLHYLLKLRGIGLVTGEVGSGKTSICRKMAASLNTGLYRVFYVPLTTGNVTDIYKSIAWEMGLTTERSLAALYRSIHMEVNRLCLESKIRPVLIIDEAQYLRNEVLENLRLLTNYEMDSQNRLCMIFVGQAELRRRLSLSVHEPLAQRLVVRYHISGFAKEELLPYLKHRLELAGTQMDLFEQPALEALFQATNGLPRKINLLAHLSLNVAALQNAQLVSAEHILTAVEETG